MSLSEMESENFTRLCNALAVLDGGNALAVLNKDTGQLLKHKQLQKDHQYKEIWDRLYTNKFGRLCQGVSTGLDNGRKRVAGTNTFHLIEYKDIPQQKQNQIIYTKVVCCLKALLQYSVLCDF